MSQDAKRLMGPIGIAYRATASFVTALALISLTLRWEWISWKQPFVDVTGYYRDLMVPILNFISIPFPFDVPLWAGDVFLPYVLLGQGMMLSLNLGGYGDIGEPAEWEWWMQSKNPIAWFIWGLFGIPILLVTAIIGIRESKWDDSDFWLFLRWPIATASLAALFLVALAVNYYI